MEDDLRFMERATAFFRDEASRLTPTSPYRRVALTLSRRFALERRLRLQEAGPQRQHDVAS